MSAKPCGSQSSRRRGARAIAYEVLRLVDRSNVDVDHLVRQDQRRLGIALGEVECALLRAFVVLYHGSAASGQVTRER